MKVLKKKKLTVMIAAGLAGVSLSSVGFAGWVINATTAVEKNDVNVEFGDVSNNAFTASLKEGGDYSLTFDCKRLKNDTNDIQGSADKLENLDISFTFNINKTNSGISGAEVFAKVEKAEIVFSAPENSPMSTLVAQNYICTPLVLGSKNEISLVDNTTTNNNTDSNTGTSAKYEVKHDVTTGGINVICTYKFAWGSAFEYKNPQDIDKTKNPQSTLKAFNEIVKDKLKGNFLNIKITPILK